MGRPPGLPLFRFTTREKNEMKKALADSYGSTPSKEIIQQLAQSFSLSSERIGQKEITEKQVWNWFQNRRQQQKNRLAKMPDRLASPSGADHTPSPGPGRPPKNPNTIPAVRPPNGQPMEFEAKSIRDGAWYDVSEFISHKLLENGEPEVRVRYSGFDAEEDEWVDLKTSVRQRSLPCEATECVAVLPDDLVLCFQEGSEQAMYFDADILEVQRRRHDVRGCRCRFWVRYRHDNSEEIVPLRKVCRRPETEHRLSQVTRKVILPDGSLADSAVPL